LLNRRHRHNQIDIFRVATFHVLEQSDATDKDIFDVTPAQQGEETRPTLPSVISRFVTGRIAA